MVRYSFPVGLFHSLQHAGLSRRTGGLVLPWLPPSGVNPQHVDKLLDILATLHAAPTVAHMDLPGFRLHPLKGDMKVLERRRGRC